MENTRSDLLLTIARQQVVINGLVKSRDALLGALNLARAELCTATFSSDVNRKDLNYVINKADAAIANAKEPTP